MGKNEHSHWNDKNTLGASKVKRMAKKTNVSFFGRNSILHQFEPIRSAQQMNGVPYERAFAFVEVKQT